MSNKACDSVPIEKFEVMAGQLLEELQKKSRPLVITENGKAAGVLLAPKVYEELVYTKSLLESVTRGLVDAAEGRVFTTEELKDQLKKRPE